MNFYDLEPEAQRRATVKRLIRYLRRVVYPYHPFARHLYKKAGLDVAKLRTADDIRRLPLMTKQDLRGDPQSFVLQPRFPGQPPANGAETALISKRHLLTYVRQALLNRPREYTHAVRRPTLKEKIKRRACLEWMPVHFLASAGSTGQPTPCSYTYYDLHRIIPELASVNMVRAKEHDPADPVHEWTDRSLNIFPGAPHLAFFAPVFAKCFVGTSSFDTFGGKTIPTERQIEIFAGGGFASLTSVPSYLVYWLRKAVEMRDAGRIEGLTSLKAIALGAEPVSDSLVVLIRALASDLGAHQRLRILESFGMTELRWAFLECTRGSGMHLNPKFYYWELLDPETKEPVGQGKPGVLTFSHVGWRGTVLVRYYTGDLVKGGMHWARCPKCGYTFATIRGPICRADKDFTKIKGTLVDLSALRDTVRDTEGVRNFQIHLEAEESEDALARDVMTVFVLPESEHRHEELAERIRQRVRQATEVTPNRICFETDAEAFESRLFARTGIKAEHIVEKRDLTLTQE